MFGELLKVFRPALLGFCENRLDQAVLRYDWLNRRLQRARSLTPAGVSQEQVEEAEYQAAAQLLSVNGAREMLKFVQDIKL